MLDLQARHRQATTNMDVELLDRRKAKKLRKKLDRGRGTHDEALAIYGVAACAGVALMTSGDPANSKRPPPPLQLSDVQNVMLWALTGDHGEMPRWVCVSRKPLIRGALLVLLPPGADAQSVVPSLATVADLTAPQPVKLPFAHHSRLASAAAAELLQVKLPRKRKAAVAAAAAEATAHGADSSHPGQTAEGGGWRLAYVRSFGASAGELRENSFPVVSNTTSKVHTVPPEELSSYWNLRVGGGTPGGGGGGGASVGGVSEPAPVGRLFAIDCEMVLVRGRHQVDGGWPLVKQLARVAIVDEWGTTLLDELVRPEYAVVDYQTRYSGITASILSSARLDLDEVRIKVCDLIGAADAALVGHSLECDLHALRLAVPANVCVLDTALLFPLRCHRTGPPTKAALRNLSVQHLQREIQQDSGGHSPVEDACAAMDLALLKLRRGYAYGRPDMTCGGVEPLHDVLSRAGWSCHAVDTSDALEAAPHRLIDVATPAPDARPSVTAMPCTDDALATRAVQEALCADEKCFVWLGLHDGLHEQPRVPGPGEPCRGEGVYGETSGISTEDRTRSAGDCDLGGVGSIAKRLRDLLATVPANTMVCLVGLQGTQGSSDEPRAAVSRWPEDGVDPDIGAPEESDDAAAPAPAAQDKTADKKHRDRRPPPGWVSFAVTAGGLPSGVDDGGGGKPSV